MQPLPLPSGLLGVESLPKFRKEVINMYVSGDEFPILRMRPGVRMLKNLGGACRGMGIYRNVATGNEEVYAVFGQKLYKITIQNSVALKSLLGNDVLAADVGDIPGSGPCLLLGGFTQLCIIQIGGLGFVYDDTNGVTEITDPNWLPSVSMSYDNGRFLFVPADGSPMFWSNLDDPGNIDFLSFADAERAPDPNKACITIKDTVWLLGSRTIQGLIYNPSVDTYIARGGESASVGYVGGLTIAGEWFAFLGQGADGGFDFYYFAGQPERISSDYVSELLNKEYSLRELTNIRAEHTVFSGTPMLIFYLPRHTLVYANGGWYIWNSPGHETWMITHQQYAYGFSFTGDAEGNLGYLDQSGAEYGEQIDWMFRTYLAGPQEQRFTLRKLALSCTMGKAGSQDRDFKTAIMKEPQAQLALSADGETFAYGPWLGMGDLGEYGKGMFWSGGLKSSRHSLCIQIKGYGDSDMAIQGVYVDAR